MRERGPVGRGGSQVRMFQFQTHSWQPGNRKLRWGLVEESSEVRADGGRAGWWRITADGRRWLLGQSRVPRHAQVYDGRLLRLERDGESVSVRDALGDRFDLDVLLASAGGEGAPV